MTGDASFSDIWFQLVAAWRWDSPVSVFFAIILASFAAGHVVKLVLPLRARSWLFSIAYKTVPSFLATVVVLLLLCLLALLATPAVLPEAWLRPLFEGGTGVRMLLIWGLALAVAGLVASFIFGSIVALNHYDLKRLGEREPRT